MTKTKRHTGGDIKSDRPMQDKQIALNFQKAPTSNFVKKLPTSLPLSSAKPII